MVSVRTAFLDVVARGAAAPRFYARAASHVFDLEQDIRGCYPR